MRTADGRVRESRRGAAGVGGRGGEWWECMAEWRVGSARCVGGYSGRGRRCAAGLS